MGYGSGSGYSSYGGGGGGYGSGGYHEYVHVLPTLFVDGNDESNFDFGYFNSQFANYGFDDGGYGGGSYGGDDGGYTPPSNNDDQTRYPGADGYLGNPFGGSGGDRPDAMSGTNWRTKTPEKEVTRTNNQARSAAFNAMFGEGSNPYGSKQADWVNNFLDNKSGLNPNSFEYNTWKGNNGFTYEIPAADINGNTDIESRLRAFYNSFANQGEYNSTARTGSIPYYLGGTLDEDSRTELLRNSAMFPQVINQGPEIISNDGTTVTYPDGTSFRTNLDVENYTFQPSGAWEVDRNGNVVNFEAVSEDTGKSTYNTQFFNQFVEDQREAYNNGESWESLSIGYRDSEGFDAEGYDADGFDRNNFNESGIDRDGYDSEGFKNGFNREGYNQQGFDVDGYNSEGFDEEGFDTYGLRQVDYDEGYSINEDGILVLPETVVTATQDDTEDNGEYNGLGNDFITLDFGDGNQNQDEGGGPGIELDTSSVANDGSVVPVADPSELFAGQGIFFEQNQEELNEIANRFGGTRRAYNDFMRSDEGQEAAKNLGDFVNDNISPSGDFDMTKRAELLDKIALIATDGGFSGLNAFAVGVNLVEGIIGTNLIDVPNVGYFIDNLTTKFLDDDLLSDIEKIVPNFVENITGLSAILQANETPSGYLAHGFDLSTYLLGDVSMAREVDYGLRPATAQLQQQQEDYLRAYLGDEMYNDLLVATPQDDVGFFQQAIDLVGDAVFGTELEQFLQDIKGQVDEEYYNEVKARVDAEPSLFNKLGELASSGFDSLAEIGSPVGDAFEAFGFNQQKYLGGAVPRNLLNLVGLASMGLPIGSLAEMVGGATAPSGQELSDYLYDRGIDPTTATRADIGAFLVNEGYDVPNFNPQTGEFIIPTTADGNEFNLDTDGDGFVDDFASNLSDFAGDDTLIGRLIGGEVTLTDGLLEIVDGTIGEGSDVIRGVTQVDQNTGPVDTSGDVFPDGSQNGELPIDEQIFGDVHNEADPNALVDDGSGGADDNTGPGTVVDNGGNIDNGNMDNENIDSSGYDAAYETAKFLLGAAEAERFRGLGLYNSELQDIIGAYSSDVSQRELERLIELNRGEQTGINELRDVQKAYDLDLLGTYGQEYADAVRGLDPTAMGVLGEQKELSDRLYRRAAGDLTAEEEADAEERAFEVAASTGRTMDSTRIANVLRAEEDMIANLEGRAQQAGTSAFNMSRNLTGNIPAMLLGNNGNPYGTGVGQVTPPLGVGDVISMGTQQYAQQQNIAQAQRQLDIVNRQYDAAVAANEPSKAEGFLAQANELIGYMSVAKQGLEFLGNAPRHYQDFKRNVSNAYTGLTTMFSGGSGKPNYNYDPNSAFNVNSYNFNTNDYLDLGTFGNTNSSGSGFQIDFGDFGS